MTTAPSNLLDVRSLLESHLHLPAVSLGITGDPAHHGGYHCGSDRVVTNDYSVVESSRDRSGLTIHASALDVGWWELRVAGRTHNLCTFSTWCVTQCAHGAADTHDIREIIYTPDGHTVKRWDRLGKRTSGDSSHLSHTHFSYFRDATKAGRDLRPLFVRYLTEIGVIDDMPTVDEIFSHRLKDAKTGEMYSFADIVRYMKVDWERYINSPLGAQLTALNAQLAQLAGRDPLDEDAVVRGVLAGLGVRPAAEVAAALVAAGQDPAALAAELTALAAPTP